jgi:hypothetical protein
MNQIITFTNMMGIEEIFPPEPAFKNIPDWYKNLESYIGGEKMPSGDGNTTGTIKRCMPVFDAINAGYIITSPADIYVSIKDGQQFFEWSSLGLISFHPIEQAPTHPLKNKHAYPKWMNHWAIRTPKGYSTMFVQPMHRESVFTILPGIVDTDQYNAPVNFPFVLNDIEYEGLIPAGTPMAQVIPFKRDSWEMNFGTLQDLEKQNKTTILLRTKFFDSYKSQFRQPKEYK